MESPRMSNVKNKETIYAILRKDQDKRDFPSIDRDVVCAFCKTLEGAEELCGEYQQAWEDSNGSNDSYYYVVGNTFYDK